MVDLNKVTIGVICGIAGGVVAGIGARIAMRGVALAANIPPSFSIGGTLGLTGLSLSGLLRQRAAEDGDAAFQWALPSVHVSLWALGRRCCHHFPAFGRVL